MIKKHIKKIFKQSNTFPAKKSYNVTYKLVDPNININKNKPDKLKVALCCIAKNENLYIREWVEYYKNLGISKIFIYDNNELDGERFEDVIGDYIDSGFVEVINKRGTEKGLVYDNNDLNLQGQCYLDCYNNRCKDFDWVCFFDVDEFLTFRNGYNLKSYLCDSRFNNYDTIAVGWEIYGDNGLVHYDNRPVQERFTKPSIDQFHSIKSIVRTGKKPVLDYQQTIIHIFRVTGSRICRADYKKYGHSSNLFTYKSLANHNCILKHYKTKSAEEYIKRHLGRHWGTTKARSMNLLSLDDLKRIYFRFCEWSREKEDYFNSFLKPKKSDLKVALCAIAKNENLYIKEWVEWYRNLGISKIFLYDNNEIDGERFEDVINDYIESGFVEVINWRGVVNNTENDKNGQTTQGLAYHDCYYKNYKNFNWICFFDIDEYLEIYSKYNSLSDFLNDFNDFDSVHVQWKMYGDNNQIYYNNKSLFERFKTKENEFNNRHIKQILKCNKYENDLIFCAHGTLNKELNRVDLLKQKIKNPYFDIDIYTDLSVYLNHFYSKSTEEFFKRKYNKTSAVSGINSKRNFNIDFLKKQYFEHNKYTEEKENFINIFINSNNTVNVYMASLYKDGHVIESIKSIIKQPQVKSLTLSANNYTDKEYKTLISKIKSDKLIIHRTKNEKSSFEKLRFVNDDISTKYVAFCDDDLIFYDGYFIKMINECEKLNAVVSYHGGILKKPLPIKHYYMDRKSFSFNREVKQNKEVDIIGNGVSLFKRDWITYNQWNDLYNNAPEVSMDDITVSYTLRKNGKKLIVIKHYPGDVIERTNNNDTVYNIYKKNDSVQTDWVNKYFISL